MRRTGSPLPNRTTNARPTHRTQSYLRRVRIDDPHILHALGSLQHHFFHVLANDCQAARAQLLVAYQIDELLDVAQQFLRDPLARAVDTHLHARTARNEGRSKHAHRYGLAEASRRRNQDLLRQMLPPVAHQDFVVVLGKLAGGGSLPENARARLQKILVEQSLVVGAVPAGAIELRQRVPAVLHLFKRRLHCRPFAVATHEVREPVQRERLVRLGLD